MTAMIAPAEVAQTLYRAAARATLAPSIHNSQPWRFTIGADRLDLNAVPQRRLPVVDPGGRQLAISCGAALAGAGLVLAAAGIAHEVELLPDAARPDLLATITVGTGSTPPDDDARRLDAAVRGRRSNRREFSSEHVPSAIVDSLEHAARHEGAWLHPVTDAGDRVAVAVLAQQADKLQNANAAYRAELRAWTTGDPKRVDGVPSVAVPHTTGHAHDDVPIRDFDTDGAGELPTETRSGLDQTLLIVGTSGDATRDWLKAGQALYRVLLCLTSAGYVASVLSQPFEIPRTRQQLRDELHLDGFPHLLLRAGVAAPTAPTPRRPLSDVITMRPAASSGR